MINYIFYTHLYNKDSGGIVVPYLICHEINKIYPNKAYIAPIFCNGNGLLDKNNDIHDKFDRSSLLLKNLPLEYFDRDKFEKPKIYDKCQLITKDILFKRDNVAIYDSYIIGNPLQQRYICRWIMYFPTPGLPVDPIYPWGKNDIIIYWSNAFYKNIDKYYRSLLNGKKKKSKHYPKNPYIFNWLFIDSNIDLEYGINERKLLDTRYLSRYSDIKGTRWENNPYLHYLKYGKKEGRIYNENRNGSCYLIKKRDPEYMRGPFKNWNDGKKYNKNHPYMKPKEISFIHPDNSYEIIDHTKNKKKNYLINIFKKYEKFYCYDLYTFHSTLAALYGCQSIVVPVKNMSKKEWHSGDKVLSYGISYGDSLEENIKEAEQQEKKITLLKNQLNSNVENLKKCINYIDSKVNLLKNKNNIYRFKYKFFRYDIVQLNQLDRIINNSYYNKKYHTYFWKMYLNFRIDNVLENSCLIFNMNYPKLHGPILKYKKKEKKCLFYLGSDAINDVEKVIKIPNILLKKEYSMSIYKKGNELQINIDNFVINDSIIYHPNNFSKPIIGENMKGYVQFKLVIMS